MKTAGMRLLLFLCALVLGGCMTFGSKCLLAVSNSGDNPVTDVVVELGGVVGYRSAVLEPHSDANYRPLREGISMPPKLSWKDKNGVAVTREVKLAKPLPTNFRGRVVFQIDNASEVRMFVMPADEAGASSIAWGNSGGWDPTILIPGMNQQ
jgi:hypothetical protein